MYSSPAAAAALHLPPLTVYDGQEDASTADCVVDWADWLIK